MTIKNFSTIYMCTLENPVSYTFVRVLITPGLLCITSGCCSTIVSVFLYDLVTVSLLSALVTGRFVLVPLGFDCVTAPIQFTLRRETVTKSQSNSDNIIE